MTFKKNLKKVLFVIGPLLITVVAIMIYFLNLSSTGEKLDKESKEYVDNVVPIISKSWDEKELRSRAILVLIPWAFLALLYEVGTYYASL
ncbi:MAG TPA: hypothetical protein VNA13_02465 [Xanthomonadales bacterium]|nr:hypothetical protein [Xanthomonadales bacterium]